jgi:hypothetical protein
MKTKLAVTTGFDIALFLPIATCFHLKSLEEYPPSQGADTLSMKKAVDAAMKKLEKPHGSSN